MYNLVSWEGIETLCQELMLWENTFVGRCLKHVCNHGNSIGRWRVYVTAGCITETIKGHLHNHDPRLCFLEGKCAGMPEEWKRDAAFLSLLRGSSKELYLASGVDAMGNSIPTSHTEKCLPNKIVKKKRWAQVCGQRKNELTQRAWGWIQVQTVESYECCCGKSLHSLQKKKKSKQVPDGKDQTGPSVLVQSKMYKPRCQLNI